MANIEVDKLFWKTLLEKNKIASQLPSISTKEEGVSFTDVGQFGEVNFKCHPASKPGDNFLSDTFIGTATTQDGTSFRTFIKIEPSNSMMRQHVTNTGTYDREIAVYSTFFDLLRQTRKEKGLSKQDMSIDVAQFYYANLDKKTNGDTEVSDTCILLEDVVATGFRMKNKHAGCDDEHVHVILNSLAKYHALTIASLNKWKDEDGKVVYPTGAQFLKKPSMMEQLTDNFAWMKDNIAKRLRLNERTDLGDWVQSLPDKFADIFPYDTIENSGPLACILHGDIWLNNMLFRYDESGKNDKQIELKMVDFQMSRIGHPTSDLLYFFYTSTLPDVRKEHLASWLSYYFNTLLDFLKKLEIQVLDYNLNDFVIDYKKRSINGMLMGLQVLMTTLDKESASNMDIVAKFMEENEDSDPEGEIGPSGIYSRRFEEKVAKYIETLPPNRGNPQINDRMIKLTEEVLLLNEISLK